jgi:hypothetical protein
MNTPTNRITIPDVSMTLEHIRHYLVLTEEQSNKLHVLIEDEETKDISNRIGWLLDDALKMLKEAHDTLYPDGSIAILNNQGA